MTSPKWNVLNGIIEMQPFESNLLNTIFEMKVFQLDSINVIFWIISSKWNLLVETF